MPCLVVLDHGVVDNQQLLELIDLWRGDRVDRGDRLPAGHHPADPEVGGDDALAVKGNHKTLRTRFAPNLPT